MLLNFFDITLIIYILNNRYNNNYCLIIAILILFDYSIYLLQYNIYNIVIIL